MELSIFLFILLKIIELIPNISGKEMKINTQSKCGNISNLEGTISNANEILLFWLESCQENETPKILSKKYSQKGEIIKKETELTFNLHDSILFRRIFSLQNGSFGVFIGSYEINSYNFWVNIFDNNFNQITFDKSFYKISNQNTLSQQIPLFHKLTNGNFILINVDIQVIPIQSMKIVSIQAKLFNSDLSLISEKAPLNQEKMITDAYYVNIINTVNDGFALIWSREIPQTSPMSVCIRNFDNNIVPQTDELIFPNTENIWATKAAKLPNGNILLIFIKEDGTYGKIFTPLASKIGNEIKFFSQGNSYTLTIKSLLNSNKFLVAWENGSDLLGTIYNQDGIMIKENFKINTKTSSKSYEQIIMKFDNGEFFVAFNSDNDSELKNKGLFGQFFNNKEQKIDPQPLVCISKNFNFPKNTAVKIDLIETVKTPKIKLHSLPSFGILIDNFNHTAKIDLEYDLLGLKYINKMKSDFDSFNFSSVDGFNEGSDCFANLLMYDQIPESKDIFFSLNRHESSIIDFINNISDHEEKAKDLFINFISLPNCGKIFSNNVEISVDNLNTNFKSTDIFLYESLNCSIGFIESFSYGAINKFNVSSKKA